MRRTLLSLAFILSLIAPAAVVAEDSGSVSAQVTVATPCILVGDAIDFGALRFSPANSPRVTGAGASSYTNCSTSPQRIYARGTDAVSETSATTWRLGSPNCTGASDNLDAYNLGVVTRSASAGLASSVDLLIDQDVPPDSTQILNASIGMPCSGSGGAGETMTFSIILTATF